MTSGPIPSPDKTAMEYVPKELLPFKVYLTSHLPNTICLLLCIENCVDFRLQVRDAYCCCFPDNIQINCLVVMNKLASHADYRSTWNLRMAIFEILGDSASCFTNDLKIVNNRILCLFLSIKLMPSPFCILYDFGDSLMDVLYSVTCICHRGTASFTTPCRTWLSNPFSVTMSTL